MYCLFWTGQDSLVHELCTLCFGLNRIVQLMNVVPSVLDRTVQLVKLYRLFWTGQDSSADAYYIVCSGLDRTIQLMNYILYVLDWTGQDSSADEL